MADRRNLSLRPRLPKTAEKWKSVSPKSHYIYLCVHNLWLEPIYTAKMDGSAWLTML